MHAGRLEQQVATVDRGIAFLKQEHLTMLTGLQLEITHLKRRCHELSCELESRFPDRNTEEEEVELEARCEAAERLLEDQHCMMITARGELQAGQARASALGRSLGEEERSFLEELKRRSHKISLLSRELQRQNVITTNLYHKLHGARLKVFQQQQSTECAAEGEAQSRGDEVEEEEDEQDEEEEEEDDSDWLLSPPPPAFPSQSEARSERRVSVREERVRACVPRERVTSPQKPRPMPDPALFLVPLRYRLIRLNQPIGTQSADGLEDEWEDMEDRSVPRRVDMGAGEGETAL
ncbi:coiled-coil domain-containing 92B [Brachionichthys hirsutus]|uniref:coiled-coil domain-containing 92B n=1 Tax=Brachionichthys hirsutus TaxID=412623 RepID=UPI0036043F71